MSNPSRHLLVAALLFAGTTVGHETETKSLLELEKPAIDKIAQLTAKEHSTILFTLADHLIGYAKEGRIEWINGNSESRPDKCQWPHPALSNDGSRVAFVAYSDVSKHCRIVIQDITTAGQRDLIETTDDPGEISWSWDDTEIAFFERGVSTVSVRNGVKRMLLAFPMKEMGDRSPEFWVWYPMRWLHNGKDLVVELNTEVPTREHGTYNQEANLWLISRRGAHLIGAGSQPAVPASSDRIAYYGSDGVMAINADGTGRAVLAKAPSTTLFAKEDLFGQVVWSPDGDRLFFGTIVSENRSDKLYLLHVTSGHREQFLSHTSIMIRGWR